MIKEKPPLNENEMRFMGIWTEVLKKRYSIPSNRMDEAASLIGYKRSGNCSTCMRNDAIELNNIYMRLFEKYKLQLELDKSLELIKSLELTQIQEQELLQKFDTEEPIKKNKK